MEETDYRRGRGVGWENGIDLRWGRGFMGEGQERLEHSTVAAAYQQQWW
jgi:hypothetical protein